MVARLFLLLLIASSAAIAEEHTFTDEESFTERLWLGNYLKLDIGSDEISDGWTLRGTPRQQANKFLLSVVWSNCMVEAHAMFLDRQLIQC